MHSIFYSTIICSTHCFFADEEDLNNNPSESETHSPHRPATDNDDFDAVDGAALSRLKSRARRSAPPAVPTHRNGADPTERNGRATAAHTNDNPDAFPFIVPHRKPGPPTAIAPAGFHSDRYNMEHTQRGHCIIINNRHFAPHLQLNERKGSDKDAASLRLRFEELGFRVNVLRDTTSKDMLTVAQMYAVEEDHSDHDCFVSVF